MDMDWMYKGPAALVDREEYLLGRTVDKSLKYLDEAEKGNTDFSYANEVEKDLTPLSIFSKSSSSAGPIDVIRKIKEDPLYQIQKKEEESLKQLLKNPVKMKQLSQLVEDRTKTKSSKHKKSKHKKKSRDSSPDSPPTSSKGNQIEDRFLKYKKQIGLVDEKGRHSSHRKERSRSRSRSRERSRDDYRYNRHNRDDHSKDRKRDYERKDRETNRSSNSTKPSSTSTSSASSSFKRPNYGQPKRPTIDEAEKEKRRLEMMDNAKWRDEQRIKSVTKYREETKLEDEKMLEDAKHEPDFIRKQLNLAASSGSVEKRIKSNSYNIQKSKSAMSQNFARR